MHSTEYGDRESSRVVVKEHPTGGWWGSVYYSGCDGSMPHWTDRHRDTLSQRGNWRKR